LDLQQVRAIARSFPGVTEAPHHDKTSFRVKGKIFATATPDGTHVHIFVDEHAVRAAVATSPACEELWWGKRLAGVRIRLAGADEGLVAELLEDAWKRKAPKSLWKWK